MKRHFSYFGTWLAVYVFSTFIWAILSAPALTVIRLAGANKGTDYVIAFLVGMILQICVLGIAVGRLSHRENRIGKKKKMKKPLLQQLIAAILVYLPCFFLPSVFEVCPNAFLFAEGKIGSTDKIPVGTMRLIALCVILIFVFCSLCVYLTVKMICDRNDDTKRLRANG